MGKLAAACDLDEMITELSLHWSVDIVDFSAKNHLVKFWNHLTGPELAEVPALLARWASRVFFRHLGEFRAAFDLLFNIFAFHLSGD